MGWEPGWRLGAAAAATARAYLRDAELLRDRVAAARRASPDPASWDGLLARCQAALCRQAAAYRGVLRALGRGG